MGFAGTITRMTPSDPAMTRMVSSNLTRSLCELKE
jgi:hypothetical protein